jgi:hypothetical protein
MRSENQSAFFVRVFMECDRKFLNSNFLMVITNSTPRSPEVIPHKFSSIPPQEYRSWRIGKPRLAL